MSVVVGFMALIWPSLSMKSKVMNSLSMGVNINMFSYRVKLLM